LVWDHEVRAGRGIDQEMSGTVTRETGDHAAVMPKGKPLPQRPVTRFPCATDRQDRASAGGPFQPGSVEAARPQLHREPAATRTSACREE
jgi:hypothetical protein